MADVTTVLAIDATLKNGAVTATQLDVIGQKGEAATERLAGGFSKGDLAVLKMIDDVKKLQSQMDAVGKAGLNGFTQQANGLYGFASSAEKATAANKGLNAEVEAAGHLSHSAIIGLGEFARGLGNVAQSGQLGALSIREFGGAATRLVGAAGIIVILGGALYEVLHKAGEEQEKLTKSLEDWYKTASQGTGGERVRQIEAEVASLTKLNDAYVKLKQNAPAPTIGGEGGATIDFGALFGSSTAKDIQLKGGALIAAQREVTAQLEQQQVDALTNLISHNRATEAERARAVQAEIFLQGRLRDGLNIQGDQTATLSERSGIVNMIDSLDKALNPAKVTQFEDRLKTLSESIAVFQAQANGTGKELTVDQRVQGFVDQLNSVQRALDDDIAKHKIARDVYAQQSAEVQRLTQAVRDSGETLKQAYSDQLTKSLQDQYNAQHQLRMDWEAGVGSLKDLTAAKQAQNEIDHLTVQQGHELTAQQQQLIRGRYEDAAALSEEEKVLTNILEAQRKLTPESMAETLRVIQNNQKTLADDFAKTWRDGLEHIANDSTGSFEQIFEDVFRLFQQLADRMEKEGGSLFDGLAELAKKKLTLAGALGAGAGGALAGYRSGDAGGGLLSGALAGFGAGGPWGAAIGAIAGLTGGIIGAGKAAKEQRANFDALKLSIDDTTNSIKNQLGLLSDADYKNIQLEQERQAQNDKIRVRDTLEAGLSAFSEAGRKALEERIAADVAANDKYYKQLEAQTAAAEDAAKAQAALAEAEKNLSAQNNYQLRFLNATGQDDAAFALQQKQEVDQAIADGLDAISMRLLLQTQAAEKAQRENEKQTRILQDQLSTAQQAYDTAKQAFDALSQFSDSLKIGQYSPLSPRQQLDASRGQLNSLYQAALGGDANAAQQFGGVAQQFLDASRKYNASGAGYVLDYNSVTVMTDALKNLYGNQMTDAQKQVSLLQQQLDALKSIDISTGILAQRPLSPSTPTPPVVGGTTRPRIESSDAVVERLERIESLMESSIAVAQAGFSGTIAATAENTSAVERGANDTRRGLESVTAAVA